MPYATIPTLADGQVLTATHLNLLGGNANYLGGLGGLPSVAFRQVRTSSAGSTFFHLRHRHRYLKAYYETTNGACDYIKVIYNGVQVLNDGDPDPAQTYSIDLNSLGLTVGVWYEIEMQTAFAGTGELRFKLLWEDMNP